VTGPGRDPAAGQRSVAVRSAPAGPAAGVPAGRCGRVPEIAGHPGTLCGVSWQIDGFRRSVGGLSPASVRAYASDVERFTEWASRAGADGPADVDRIVLRRYLAYLATRRYAKASIARIAASLRSYFQWCARRGWWTTIRRPGCRRRRPTRGCPGCWDTGSSSSCWSRSPTRTGRPPRR